MKIDAVGDTVWTNRWIRNDNIRGHTVEQTNDGGDIVAGYTASFGAGDDDFFLLKISGDEVPDIRFDDVPDERRNFLLLQ